ncbi:MAG: hydrolase [Paracoccaceae bacterium]
MKTNALPRYDDSVNETGCCPKFNPEGWDGRHLHFEDKAFVRAKTRSVAHIPLNMARVFQRTFGSIEAADAGKPGNIVVLSRELSPFSAEHLFAVSRPVEGQETVRLSGDFLTKVFEGPYREAPRWETDLAKAAEGEGKAADKTYFFYTTCPKCAKHYGKNYVVGVTRLH